MRYALPLLALAVLAAGCGSRAAKPAPPPFRGFAIQPPKPAPSFSLADQHGRRVGPQDDRGHWLVVTFLYTHCPDTCPLVANRLRVAMAQLPDLRAIAVSVDPVHDTPAAVDRFLRAHDLPARFHYVTGTRAELLPVWHRYGIATAPGPSGTIGHSAFELLIDPHGRERVLYDARLRPSDVVQAVRALE